MTGNSDEPTLRGFKLGFGACLGIAAALVLLWLVFVEFPALQRANEISASFDQIARE